MNNIYSAKRRLRIAGLLDMFCAMFWIPLIFIVTIFHFGYLIPKGYPNSSGTGSSDTSTVASAWGQVSSGGYSKLFDLQIVDFLLFKLTLWTIVLVLFILAVTCFVGKVVFGTSALFSFFKNKSIHHIYASLAVVFFPALGGVIALNTYKATTSRLAPKYIASNSSIRFKVRSWWNEFSKSDTFKPESNSVTNAD